MNPMTPKDRILAAINYEEPDRVPIVMGVSNATGIKMKPYQQLKAIQDIQAPDRYLYDWSELGTAAPDEDTMERLHADVRGVLDREPLHIRNRNADREPGSPYVDSWGAEHGEIEPGVWFPSVHPLADAVTIDALENYPWPDMDDVTRVAHTRERARKLVEDNHFAVMGTPWLLFPFERAFAMQGMDAFLTNMALYPDFAEALLEKNATLCKQLMGHFLKETGEYLDIIKIGDDLGTQESLLISPRMYRKILKPIHAGFIAFIKERTDAKVFFHTDGDVFSLIEDFIEIGVDILNPIQTSAGKMSNLAELKRRYGKEIVFCGGIDTHRILPNGTPQEVTQEVKRVIKILAPGGGYMVSSVHTIMNDVPAENILAMVDAVDQYGRYPIKA